MSYNLHTRVDKLERRAPSPVEQMTDSELRTRLAWLQERLSETYGFNYGAMDIAERRMLLGANEQGDTAAVDALLKQFRQKYGPPLIRGMS